MKKLKYPDVDPEYMQFKNEFDHLKKLRHPNIVQILGYCYETQKKPFIMDDRTKVTTEEIYAALCLEYLDNGSLQKHLSGTLQLHFQYVLEEYRVYLRTFH